MTAYEEMERVAKDYAKEGRVRSEQVLWSRMARVFGDDWFDLTDEEQDRICRDAFM